LDNISKNCDTLHVALYDSAGFVKWHAMIIKEVVWLQG
jgi:hypothetical protein